MSDTKQAGEPRIELVEKAVAILRERGIECTNQEMIDWSKLVAQRWMDQHPGKVCTPTQWLWGVTENLPTPTMCLHLHFGDAKDD